jgi:2-keto-4-pentenoate hydratase/2-oxohepta-3-ene-1,7-dioic acid hydratase in catechol pathway
VTRYVRFQNGSTISYGIEHNGSVKELAGTLFQHRDTGHMYALKDVKLLYPCQPVNVFCVGLNYRSHIGNRPTPKQPEIFFKPLGCLQNPGDPVLIPPGATDLHYEGELVLVIGKHLRNASKEEAKAAIFGVTCGNDISERQWQHGPNKDRQWWRAKGSETFGPFGPAIVTGLNYDNLRLQTRLNGEVVQDQTTADLLFDCATMVSFASQYLPLQPGDVIFTGTPGDTRPMKPGDIVEIEIEGIGTLSNPIVKAEPRP